MSLFKQSKSPWALLLVLFLALAGCKGNAMMEEPGEGEFSPPFTPAVSESKEDGTGVSAIKAERNYYYTQVWEINNQWEDKTTTAAKEAGLAWGANSGLNWDQKYVKWVKSLPRINSTGGYNTYSTYSITNPYGKTLPAPALECAETAYFLRATFASWYKLPFYVETVDSSGRRVFLGHFGFRTSTSRYGNTPNFKRSYQDHRNLSAQAIAANWPQDSSLRGKKLGDDDLQLFLGADVHMGVYLDEMFLNKRVGHFMVYLLTWFGSINLASTRNTYNLKPEAIQEGDVLLERWQRTGIGHTLVVKNVEALDGGHFDAELVSGSMPRRQGVWESAASSKYYFTLQATGGTGTNADGEEYAKLGGGIKRWRVTKKVSGKWRNTFMDADRSSWINSGDYAAIAARPGTFEEILGNLTPQQKRDVYLANIQAKRQHLEDHPASCSARIAREDNFEKLYELMHTHFGKTRAQVDQLYRTLADYVFAELTYNRSKTCCWNGTTRAMYNIIMEYAQSMVNAGGTCHAPPVFKAVSGGYDVFKQYAISTGRGNQWVSWSEDESCPQRDTQNDEEADHEWAAYCDVLGGGGTGDACSNMEPNENQGQAQTVQDGTDASVAICDNDEDWYKLVLSGSSEVTVEILFSHSNGDLDLALKSSQGSQLAISQSSSDNEKIVKTLAAGTYYVRVYGYNGAQGDYRLKVAVGGGGTTPTCTDDLEPNDARSGAAAVNSGTYNNLKVCAGDIDFYKVVVPSGGSLRATINFTHSAGDLDMELLNSSGGRITVSQSTENTESVTASSAGTYYLRVYGYSGATGDYSLTISM